MPVDGKKDRGGKAPKRYRVEFSRTSIVLWSAGAFFVLGWIFFLGVLAGKGLLPGGVKTLAELKAQIARLQQMISKRDRTELQRIKELHKDPKFVFYDELSEKKSEPVRKAAPPPGRRKKGAVVRPDGKKAMAGGRYVVQVASLDSEARAAAMVKDLVERGYPAYSYKVFVRGRRYYRVRCGMFKSRAEAVDVKQRLARQEKLDGLVKRVKEPSGK